MPGLLQTVTVTDEQRRANDRHRPLVVVPVVLVLLLYGYLFTPVHILLSLPAPQHLAHSLGLSPEHVFDEDGLLDYAESVSLDRFEPRPEAPGSEWTAFYDAWLGFYLVVLAAFVCAYFLPLRLKYASLVAWSIVAVGVLYGWRATAGLVAAHLVVYQVLHAGRRRGVSLAAGLLLAVAYGPVTAGPRAFAPWLLLPIVWTAVYELAVLRLLQDPRRAAVLRTVVVQSALLTVLLGAVVEGLGHGEWFVPLGVVLFFWQWQRLIMYHVDYKDGLVPRDLPLVRYLVVFFTPGAMPYWDWGGTTGQGYAYSHNNFLCEDKNRLVLSGLKFLLLALAYLTVWDWARHLLVRLFEGLGIAVHQAETVKLVEHFVAGGEVGALSVLATTFLDLARWLLLFGGIVHFKVGVWRICGYRIAPYFDKPWLSTNLVTFWSRFTFHYREFLVRAFYYPVFFRFFRKRRWLRVVAATMAAAGLGNLVWGHLTEEMLDGGLRFANFRMLQSWPYFLLLGAGISVTELYLLHRKSTRRKWSPGPRLIGDVLAAYCTWQFYALIHIFNRPVPGSTVWDHFRLFLRAFGLHL